MELTGKLVFSSGKDADYDIFTLDFESKLIKQLTAGTYWNDQPRWSPDGSSIVFVSNRSGVQELWRMDAEGKNLSQITNQGKHNSYPAWSPDGKKLVCCANYNDPDEIDLWFIDPEGLKAPELVVESRGIETYPCFTPDGNQLILSAPRAGNNDIWKYDLVSKEWTQLTRHIADDYSPAISPDGKFIAFASTREESGPDFKDDADIWIMSSDGRGKPKQLTRNHGADRYVSWSPDGKYIAYCASQPSGGADRIQLIELALEKVIKLDYDRTKLEEDTGAVVRDFGLFTNFMPDIIQRMFVDKTYFGGERFPHWIGT